MSEPSDTRTAATWRNWAGDERCRPVAVERPGSIEEISEAIARAAHQDRRIRVAGAGHSFSDVALTDGVQLRLEELTRVLDVDRASGLVRVQAGITISELNLRLAEHGLALENLGDVDAQTIAGAICTATHGTGAKLRNISAQVRELTLVLADGSTMQCSEERDPEVFRAARVGLGALGVVAEVTLGCVPAFTLRGVDGPAPLGETLERFEELALGNDHFELFVFPHAGVALTRTNNRTEEAPRPRGRVCGVRQRRAPDQPRLRADLPRRAQVPRPDPPAQPARDAPGRELGADRPLRSDLRQPAIGALHRDGVRARARAHTRGGPSCHGARPRARLCRAVPDRGAGRWPRTTRSSRPQPVATAGIVAVHMYEGMEWEPYFRAVEAIMDELGGRPHWGKRHFQTAQKLRGRYPDWDRFQAVRARLDPEGRFANAWTDRILGPTHPSTHPSTHASTHIIDG